MTAYFSGFTEVSVQVPHGKGHADALFGKRLACWAYDGGFFFKAAGCQGDIGSYGDVVFTDVFSNPVISSIEAVVDDYLIDEWMSFKAHPLVCHHVNRQVMPICDFEDFGFYRAGICVYIYLHRDVLADLENGVNGEPTGNIS